MNLRILTGAALCVLSIQASRAQDYAQANIWPGDVFWCIEAPFDKVEGVVSAVFRLHRRRARKTQPTSKSAPARTKHIESVLVTFDPEVVSYSQLLDIYWRQFDPTDPGGSFYDRGHQYTSAIFYHDEEQRTLAAASKTGSRRFGPL